MAGVRFFGGSGIPTMGTEDTVGVVLTGKSDVRRGLEDIDAIVVGEQNKILKRWSVFAW
jgi:hypothetical protein